jgi:hypothetical protein
MHFDTDENKVTLNEQFVKQFGEIPPAVIINTFNVIGNPLARMKRMHELIEVIIKQIETSLNKNKDQPEHHESYYLTPEVFDKIFHNKLDIRRKSSNEVVILNSVNDSP